MATNGKRLIFSDGCTLPAQEGLALTGDILPGMIVEYTTPQPAGGVTLQKDETAATVFGAQPLIADYDMLGAGTVDDAWSIGETMISRQLSGNFRGNVLVAAGNNITSKGFGLTKNGDGTFRIAASDGTEDILCVSDEVINVTGTAQLVMVRGI